MKAYSNKREPTLRTEKQSDMVFLKENHRSIALQGVDCQSGKKAYSSKSDAESIIQIVKKHRHEQIGQSVYKCDECGFWHIRTNNKTTVNKPPIPYIRGNYKTIYTSKQNYHKYVLNKVEQKDLKNTHTVVSLDNFLSDSVIEKLTQNPFISEGQQGTKQVE